LPATQQRAGLLPLGTKRIGRLRCYTSSLQNRNTTIGYATFDAAVGELTYIFVNRAFRNHGFGTMLVDAAQRASGKFLKPAEPLSPLGKQFFEAFYKS
jgi:hypothetical protein